MTAMDLGISQEHTEQFCHRWKISRLAVFGSAAEACSEVNQSSGV
jgi:predicted nucleotidyltransferase